MICRMTIDQQDTRVKLLHPDKSNHWRAVAAGIAGKGPIVADGDVEVSTGGAKALAQLDGRGP